MPSSTEGRPRVFALPSASDRPVVALPDGKSFIQFEFTTQSFVSEVPKGFVQMDGDLDVLSPSDGKTPTGQLFEYWFKWGPELRLMRALFTPGEPCQLIELGVPKEEIIEFDVYEVMRIELWNDGWQLAFDLDAVD